MVILEVTPSLLHSGCAKVQLSYPNWDIQSFQVISWEITTSKSPPPTLFYLFIYFFFQKQAQKEYPSDCYDPTSCQKYCLDRGRQGCVAAAEQSLQKWLLMDVCSSWPRFPSHHYPTRAEGSPRTPAKHAVMRPKCLLRSSRSLQPFPMLCAQSCAMGGWLGRGDTPGHPLSLPAPAWPQERRRKASTAFRAEGWRACRCLFSRKQTGLPDTAPEAPCYFLRKVKNECSRQLKEQQLPLEHCWWLPQGCCVCLLLPCLQLVKQLIYCAWF